MAFNYLPPSINPLKSEQISVFIPDVISANAAVVTLPILVAGKLKLIAGTANRIPATGPVTYTVALIHNGSSAPVTDGLITIPVLGVIAGEAITQVVSQSVAVGDSLVITVGGTQTGAGTGNIAFSIS